MIYLDNSASTAVLKVTAEVINYYNTELYFNPSAVYSGAISAYNDIAAARKVIAESLGVDRREIHYFSGGTEANNAAIFGCLKAKKGRVITTAGEHMSVYKCFNELSIRGYDVKYAKLNLNGTVDMEHLSSLITPDTLLVSAIHVSNETGAVNDIKQISKITKAIAPNCLIHSDGVQAYLKRFINVKDLNVDMYTVSGHKVHAPKGIAALYIKGSLNLKTIIFGGGQENGLRSGTENVSAICAFSHSVKALGDGISLRMENISKLKKIMHETLSENLDGLSLNGDMQNGAPNILSLGIKGVKSEVLIQMLSDKGVYIGSGSACSSSQKASRVLKEMQAKFIDGAVRISFSHFNTKEQIIAASSAITECVKKLRSL